MRRCIAVIMMVAAALAGWLAPLRAQVNTDQVMRMGRNALYFDDYMVAIQYFNMVIEAKPWLAEPYFYRSVAKINLDDYAGAEADASTALDKNEFLTDAYEVRGVARQNLGRPTDAIGDYQRVLRDKPDSRSVLYNLALAQVDTRRPDEASATFTRLISRYPRFDGGYLARARLELQEGDTLGALADIGKAIDLNAAAANAYLMRADIAMARIDPDTADPAAWAAPLADVDQALRLMPDAAGLYVNRAYLRYRSDDYIGAMADFDRAIELDPVNTVAHYNRGLLRAEVRDINNAIDDFSAVIDQNPRQYRAIFNRANLYRETGDLNAALADINRVLEAFPDFAAAMYLRAEVQHRRGQRAASDRDFKRSIELARRRVVMLPDSDVGADTAQSADSVASDDIFAESQEAVTRRFSSLLRVEGLGAAATSASDYAGGSTRGRIQDTAFAVRLEPPYLLGYHAEPSELKAAADFLRELDALNQSRALPATLLLVAREPALDADAIDRHRKSIDYYNSWLATHPARAADYLGRSVDLFTLHDLDGALQDLDRAIQLSPDFALAWLQRGVVRWRSAEVQELRGDLRRALVEAALADLDEALRLSPNMAVAWYDRGCILAAEGLWSQARDAFSQALAQRPDFGEAFFNRGYTLMMLGDKESAFADLSRAGQLGIAPAYNLLKRMAR